MAIVHMPIYRQLSDFLSLASIAISIAKIERERRRSPKHARHVDPPIGKGVELGPSLLMVKKRDATGGDGDIAAAKAIEANIVGDFARYGVQQRRALDHCGLPSHEVKVALC
jgi:hypothetical protein